MTTKAARADHDARKLERQRMGLADMIYVPMPCWLAIGSDAKPRIWARPFHIVAGHTMCRVHLVKPTRA